MTIRIDLKGADVWQNLMRTASAETREHVSAAVVETALDLRTRVVKSIKRRSPGGVTYQKYNPRRTHQASGPGLPPNTDTGRLINSIEFDQIGQLTATVGSKLAYAVYLEYGTRKMRARPFFRVAVAGIATEFQKRLERAVTEATRR